MAGHAKIHLKDLKNEPLIISNRDYYPELYDHIIDIFSKAGYKPSMIQETYRRLTAIALVATGMGVSPVPESTKLLGRENVVYRPIADPFPSVEVIAVWPENNHSPVLKSFVQLVRNSSLNLCKD